jgi:3-oxoacid CoA-transferase
MEHTNKNGESKILKKCSLPLTGKNVVNVLITELAVFEVCPKEGLTLIEKIPNITIEELRAKTDAPFKISKNLIDMRQ